MNECPFIPLLESGPRRVCGWDGDGEHTDFEEGMETELLEASNDRMNPAVVCSHWEVGDRFPHCGPRSGGWARVGL